MDEKDITQLSESEIQNVSGGAYIGPYIVYTIQHGDTLSRIAAMHGTTVQIIVELNNITNKNKIRAGHKLLIPAK